MLAGGFMAKLIDQFCRSWRSRMALEAAQDLLPIAHFIIDIGCEDNYFLKKLLKLPQAPSLVGIDPAAVHHHPRIKNIMGSSKALERLAAAFRDGAVHKTYWALCCTLPEPREGHLEGWLHRNEQQNKSYIVADGATPKPGRYPDAKLAKLNYRYLRSTDRYHLVEVELLTGRHHQIRCQLAHLGCPIKGDLKYGAPRSNPDGGICLHARQIRFTHPVRKEEMVVEAPVPESWKGV